jgi:hypothetical protein
LEEKRKQDAKMRERVGIEASSRSRISKQFGRHSVAKVGGYVYTIVNESKRS